MNNIYTCPYCERKYNVTKPGNYICDCGVRFNYPEILSTLSNSHTFETSEYIDSTSKSIKKSSKANYFSSRKMQYITQRCCLFSKASLACGILGLVFFGISSVPAILFGILSMKLIACNSYNLSGSGHAYSGILLGIAGTGIWIPVLFCCF